MSAEDIHTRLGRSTAVGIATLCLILFAGGALLWLARADAPGAAAGERAADESASEPGRPEERALSGDFDGEELSSAADVSRGGGATGDGAVRGEAALARSVERRASKRRPVVFGLAPVDESGAPVDRLHYAFRDANNVTRWRGDVDVVEGMSTIRISAADVELLKAGRQVGASVLARWRLDLADSWNGLNRLVEGLSLEPVEHSVASLDLGTLDWSDGSREDSLGTVVLARPRPMGAAVFTGEWSSHARIDAVVTTRLQSLGIDRGPGAERPLRWSWEGAVDEAPIRLWVYGDALSWSGRARPSFPYGPSDAQGSVRLWRPSDRAKDEALAGVDLSFPYPGRSGLRVALDLASAEGADLLLAFSVTNAPERVGVGEARRSDSHRRRSAAADAAIAVPDLPDDGSMDSHETEPFELPDGPARLELWSRADDEGVRSLLAVRDVSSGPDIPLVTIP